MADAGNKIWAWGDKVWQQWTSGYLKEQKKYRFRRRVIFLLRLWLNAASMPTKSGKRTWPRRFDWVQRWTLKKKYGGHAIEGLRCLARLLSRSKLNGTVRGWLRHCLLSGRLENERTSMKFRFFIISGWSDSWIWEKSCRNESTKMWKLSLSVLWSYKLS